MSLIQHAEEKGVGKFERLGAEIGRLVDKKSIAYGDAFGKSEQYLKLLAPDGIHPDQYKNLLALVRLFDKQVRVATNKDAFGENPWMDMAGYCLLMVLMAKESGTCQPG